MYTLRLNYKKIEIINIFLAISNQYFEDTLLRSISCKPGIDSPEAGHFGPAISVLPFRSPHFGPTTSVPSHFGSVTVSDAYNFSTRK